MKKDNLDNPREGDLYGIIIDDLSITATHLSETLYKDTITGSVNGLTLGSESYFSNQISKNSTIFNGSALVSAMDVIKGDLSITATHLSETLYKDIITGSVNGLTLGSESYFSNQMTKGGIISKDIAMSSSMDFIIDGLGTTYWEEIGAGKDLYALSGDISFKEGHYDASQLPSDRFAHEVMSKESLELVKNKFGLKTNNIPVYIESVKQNDKPLQNIIIVVVQKIENHYEFNGNKIEGNNVFGNNIKQIKVANE